VFNRLDVGYERRVRLKVDRGTRQVVQGAAVYLPTDGCALTTHQLVQGAHIYNSLLYFQQYVEALREARKLFRIFKSVDEFQAIKHLLFF
jgi:hypothetical protein